MTSPLEKEGRIDYLQLMKESMNKIKKENTFNLAVERSQRMLVGQKAQGTSTLKSAA